MRRVLIVACVIGIAPPAFACSTCACGDYTITLMGAEKPFSGRLRAAVDFSARSESKGIDGTLDSQRFDEWRTNFGASYSVGSDVTLGVQVPYVRKRVRSGDLGQIDTQGLGDADLLLRWVTFRDRAEVPRHLAGIRAGVRLPTSTEVKDSSGNVVDIDAQPDAGAVAPSLGLWYGYYRFPVFVSASVYYLRYGSGRQDFDPGDAVLGSVTAQYALNPTVALQAGIDARHTDVNRFSGVEDPDSGGFLSMGFVGAALRFGEDFVVHAGVQIPLVERLDGEQDEDVSYRVGVAYDFSIGE